MENQGRKPKQIEDSILTVTILWVIGILWLIAVYIMTHYNA